MGMCGIIFDLDGVLCYTDHYHYLAWKALADRLSLPFDEQVNNRLRGVSRMESLEIIQMCIRDRHVSGFLLPADEGEPDPYRIDRQLLQ